MVSNKQNSFYFQFLLSFLLPFVKPQWTPSPSCVECSSLNDCHEYPPKRDPSTGEKILVESLEKTNDALQKCRPEESATGREKELLEALEKLNESVCVFIKEFNIQSFHS